MSKTSWGYELIIDLYDCDLKLIQNKDKLKQFAFRLTEMMNVMPFGYPKVLYFGNTDDVKGFTLVQYITTSLISGHFVDAAREAYINIFSCKEFEHEKLADFSADYFNGSIACSKLTFRGKK